jgi:hypothetical protein
MAVSSMTMFLIGCAAFQVRDIKSQARAEASFSGVFNIADFSENPHKRLFQKPQAVR